MPARQLRATRPPISILRLRNALRGTGSEEGFGMIEAMVAIGVVFLALIALMATSITALRDTGLARQRQSANGIANGAMELVRSMALPELQNGLSSTDPLFLADPNVVSCSGEYHFRSCPGEKLVTSPGSTAGPPLVPHEAPVSVQGSPTGFTRRVYVMEAAPNVVPSAGGYRVVVEVLWSDTMSRGASTVAGDTRTHAVESQSIVYSPVGCVDPALNPFSGPCSPFFSAAGQSEPGRIEVSNSAGGAPLVSLRLPGARSQMQMEQIVELETSAQGSGAFPGDASVVPGASARSRADDDPSTVAVPASDDSGLVGNGPSNATATTLLGTAVQVSASAHTETLRATSAVAAAANCPTEPFAARNDGLPCGLAYAEQAANRTLHGQVAFEALGISAFQTTLVSATTPSGQPPSYQRIDRVAEPGKDGSVVLTGVRHLGRVELLRLPPLLETVYKAANPNWDGYLIALENYNDQVTVAAGTGTSPPAPSVGSSATLKVWDAVARNYESLPLQSPISPKTLATVDISANVLALVNLRAEMGAVIEGGGGTSFAQEPATASGIADRTAASATVNSPLRATFTFKLTATRLTSTEVLDLTVVVDLGSHTARTIYRAGADA